MVFSPPVIGKCIKSGKKRNKENSLGHTIVAERIPDEQLAYIAIHQLTSG